MRKKLSLHRQFYCQIRKLNVVYKNHLLPGGWELSYLVVFISVLHFTNADGLVVPINQQVNPSTSLQIFVFVFIIPNSIRRSVRFAFSLPIVSVIMHLLAPFSMNVFRCHHWFFLRHFILFESPVLQENPVESICQ